MIQQLREATLVFLIRRDGEKIEEVCLAMKKRGFGAGRWNGVGGKVEAGETPEDSARREAQEEIGVTVKDLRKVAELTFTFPHHPDWDQKVHVYFTETWEGIPKEGEEMRPASFKTNEIPYDRMWADDVSWLPPVLAGNLIKAAFTFNEDETVQHEDVKMVENL